MVRKDKKKSPSRKRYEKENPVVSFRAPRALYDRLRVAREVEGLSYTNIIERGLQPIEVKVRTEAEIRQQVWDEAWQDGVDRAVAVYGVPYPCSICGKEIEVTTDMEKAAIKRYMRENGWGHAECHER